MLLIYTKMCPGDASYLPPACFLKTVGGVVLGSVAVSTVSAVSSDVLPYISVVIKASFFKLAMCNICKNTFLCYNIITAIA